MALWTATEAAAATDGRVMGNWQEVQGISIDTRSLQSGDLFVALKAARDGHDFVAQALEQGASAALVSYVPDGLPDNAPLLMVKDVQAALEALGRAARARTSAKVIAVTGSVGKTSTKEMLAVMLADQGHTHAAVASFNNHWGVPLTLARMPVDTEFAVIEIGMNHPGEIAPLARQACPNVAMITTVAAVHLEAFEDVAAIAVEKAAIMEGLTPDGLAVLNADVSESPILKAEAERLGAKAQWFGKTADWAKLLHVEASADGICATVQIDDTSHKLVIQSLGVHFAMNALGALVAVQAAGGDLERAIASLRKWSPVKGRGQTLSLVHPDGAITVLDDSYNANPTSVRAALAVLGATQSAGKRLACLGDMGELGSESMSLHASLAKDRSLANIDRLYCVGPLMRALYDALPAEKQGGWFETSDQAAAVIEADVAGGDTLLVKGSLYMKMVKVVDALREIGQVGASI